MHQTLQPKCVPKCVPECGENIGPERTGAVEKVERSDRVADRQTDRRGGGGNSLCLSVSTDVEQQKLSVTCPDMPQV